MTSFALQLALFLLMAMGLGAVLARTQRGVNQAVGLLILIMIWWLSHNLITLSSTESVQASWHIRWASIAAAWIPILAQVLRLTIKQPDNRLIPALIQAWPYLFSGILIIPVCLADPFILDVTWTQGGDGNLLANPTYGPMGTVYGLYMLAHILIITLNTIRDRRTLSGLQRVEMDYLLSALLSGLSLGILVGLLSNLLLGTAKAVPLTNAAAATAMVAVMAYGVTARRIMDVHQGARHLAAILLQLLILMLIFGLALKFFSNPVFGTQHLAEYIAAAALIFASLPLHTWTLRLEGWLFSSDRRNEAVERLEAIQLILSRGATVQEMLRTFEDRITRLLDVDRIMVFTLQEGHPNQVWPEEKEGAYHNGQSAIISYFMKHPHALSLEQSLRTSIKDLSDQAIEELKSMGMALAIPTMTAGAVSGFVLFSPRRGGRIFTDDQIRFAHACSEQLEIGLNNVVLFSQVEAAHRYHQALVHHIASGVIAVDPMGHINVSNQKAKDLLSKEGLHEEDLEFDKLPKPLVEIYDEALTTTQTPLHEFSLHPEHANPRPLRCVAAAFPVAGQATPGVVMLLDDLTEMRKLEKSVDEKEEMARIGQLAAQMAHEIKNPLQTLRTFFDLYPVRKNDANFTLRFADLASNETQRIDQIVNRLMKYVRHDPPDLKLISIHQIISDLAEVFNYRLANDDKVVTVELNAERDEIMGDSDQLVIVLDNLLSNALQSMTEGEVHLSTYLGEFKRFLHIKIVDCGVGITKEDLPHIFEPFFSRKVYGTGLGLVTVKRMIEDHDGSISVESEYGVGSTFRIQLPLASPQGGLS